MRLSCLLPASVLLLGASAVWAAEGEGTSAEPYAANLLSTLHFYVPARSVQPNLSLTQSLDESSHESTDASATSDTKRTSTTALVGVAYGILEGLWAELDETEVIKTTTKTTNVATSKVTTDNTAGWSDPSLKLTWRCFQEGGLFVNAGAAFSPLMIARQDTTSTHEGNDGKGYASETFNLTIFGVSGRHEVSGGLTLMHNGRETSNADTLNNTSETDAATTVNLVARYRAHLTSSLYVQPSATAYTATSSSTTYPYRKPALRSDGTTPDRLLWDLGLGFLPTPTWLVSLTIYENESSSSGTETGTSAKTTNKVQQTYAELAATTVL